MERKSIHCFRCGHDWYSKKDNIRMCPKCKSIRYDVQTITLTIEQSADINFLSKKTGKRESEVINEIIANEKGKYLISFDSIP